MPQTRLRIVADAHIWGVRDAFRHFAGFTTELTVVEHAAITRELLAQADVLVTRSSTRVDADLLAGTPVRFVGTATVGDDHVDKGWLSGHGIAFASAAGSSTGSVVEYWIASLLALHDRGLVHLPDLRLGVVGVGRIGGCIAAVAEKLGLTVLYNDPPRARHHAHNGDVSFQPLDRLLAECDVLTLHTPLTTEAPDATRHLLDARTLDAFQGRGIINTARGGVIDNDALGLWLDGDATRFAILDCWEHEPGISRRLLAHPGMAIATPHIAGHSLDGKAANTLFVHQALCDFLGCEPAWDMAAALPDPKPDRYDIRCTGDPWQDLHQAVSALYAIARDDAALKSALALDDASLAAAFREQRRHYAVRRAWDVQAIHFSAPDAGLAELARAIGLHKL
jgi:erythronate-4-phosphate dehydrogenase